MILAVTVELFAVFMVTSKFGSYFVCIFLALGYLMMALSTFFIGLTIKPENKKDKWLKCLMMIHGVFFFGCLIMPMTGIFSASMAEGTDSLGGIIALEFWCAYFLPIGILSMLHFYEE